MNTPPIRKIRTLEAQVDVLMDKISELKWSTESEIRNLLSVRGYDCNRITSVSILNNQYAVVGVLMESVLGSLYGEMEEKTIRVWYSNNFIEVLP